MKMNMLSELMQPWCITDSAYQTIYEGINTHDPKCINSKSGEWLRGSWDAQLRGKTAVIPVLGPIFRYMNYYSYYYGGGIVQNIAEDFQTAIESDKVDSIVLYIDSPGGQVTGVSELSDIIYKNRSIKPVIAYVDGMGASGAYWLGAACSKVVISKTSILGSIGVVSIYKKQKEDNIFKIVSSLSPKKQLDPQTDEGRKEALSNIDALAEVFISSIATYRNTTKEKVISDFGQGGTFVGGNAVQAGLADEVSDFENLLKDLNGNDGGEMIGDRRFQTLEQQLESLAQQNPEIAKKVLSKFDSSNNTNFGGSDNSSGGSSLSPQNMVSNSAMHNHNTGGGGRGVGGDVNIEAIKTQAYEQGKKETLETTREIMNCCQISGVNSLEDVYTMVETQNPSLAKLFINTLRAKKSENEGISSSFSGDGGKRNYLVEAVKKMAKSDSNSFQEGY